jgi:hypothetical protein
VTRSLLLSLQHAFAVQLLREHVCCGGRGEWLLRYTASPTAAVAAAAAQQQQLQLSPGAKALPPRSPLRRGTTSSPTTATATATVAAATVAAATGGSGSGSSRGSGSSSAVSGAVIESAVGVVLVTDAVAALQLQQAQCSSDSPPLQLCGIEAAVRRLLSDDELMATLQQVHYCT